MSNSPGLVDFTIRLVNSVLNLPNGKVKFCEEFKLHKNCVINPAHQKVVGASEMNFGLGHTSCCLPKWQAVKLTFSVPWLGYIFLNLLCLYFCSFANSLMTLGVLSAQLKHSMSYSWSKLRYLYKHFFKSLFLVRSLIHTTVVKKNLYMQVQQVPYCLGTETAKSSDPEAIYQPTDLTNSTKTFKVTLGNLLTSPQIPNKK